MTDESEPMLNPNEAGSALNNIAVAICWHAWISAYRKSIDQGKDHESSRKDGGKAYRAAMPPLAGIENI